MSIVMDNDFKYIKKFVNLINKEKKLSMYHLGGDIIKSGLLITLSGYYYTNNIKSTFISLHKKFELIIEDRRIKLIEVTDERILLINESDDVYDLVWYKLLEEILKDETERSEK